MAELDQTELQNPVQMEYQGIGIRFVSLVIDSLIISIIFGVLGSILGAGMMRQALGRWACSHLHFISPTTPIWRGQEGRPSAR
jgi:hypothetical protein